MNVLYSLFVIYATGLNEEILPSAKDTLNLLPGKETLPPTEEFLLPSEETILPEEDLETLLPAALPSVEETLSPVKVTLSAAEDQLCGFKIEGDC